MMEEGGGFCTYLNTLFFIIIILGKTVSDFMDRKLFQYNAKFTSAKLEIYEFWALFCLLVKIIPFKLVTVSLV